MDIQQLRREALKRIMGSMTQKGFAELHNLEPSYISQLINGHRSIGEKAALNLESKIGLPAGTLLSPVSSDTGQDGSERIQSSRYVQVKALSAEASAGNGHENSYVEEVAGVAVSKKWLLSRGVCESNACFITVSGFSMSPWLDNGDMVLIDCAQREITDSSVYAIRRPDGSVSIKRLIQNIDGSWLIASDNADKARYPNERLCPETAATLPIIGKVIWRGGAMY